LPFAISVLLITACGEVITFDIEQVGCAVGQASRVQRCFILFIMTALRTCQSFCESWSLMFVFYSEAANELVTRSYGNNLWQVVSFECLVLLYMTLKLSRYTPWRRLVGEEV
jgi:hypothetical protein